MDITAIGIGFTVIIELQSGAVTDYSGNTNEESSDSYEFWEESGIEDVTDNEIHIYPNPVKDFIRINSNEKLNIMINEITGKQILNLNDFTGKIIDVSNLQSGLYILKIHTKEKILVKKIIIK